MLLWDGTNYPGLDAEGTPAVTPPIPAPGVLLAMLLGLPAWVVIAAVVLAACGTGMPYVE